MSTCVFDLKIRCSISIAVRDWNLHDNSKDDGNLNPVSVSGVDIVGNNECRDQRNDGYDSKDEHKNVVDLVPDLLEKSLLLLFGELVLSVLFKPFRGLCLGKTNLSDVTGETELLDDLFHGHGMPWAWVYYGDDRFFDSHDEHF